MSATDEDILAASLDNPQVFGGLFERYFATIHGYLARRIGRGRADDLAGEVFRIAFAGRASYEITKGAVRAWLYGIANNVMRQHLRDGERAERAWTRLASAPNLDGTELGDRLDAELVVAKLRWALDQLLPADREALVLYAVEQLTYSEVASVMDTPIGTVRSRIARARNQLRAAVDLLDAADAERQGVQHG